jgi:23S rRNA pseudouridine1911/1915/1917 synthase
MKHRPFEILLEDNHLLAVAKPANLPTMGVEAAQISLITLVRDYLREKYQKPGNVYVGIVSRLDSLATGVIVLARTSKAASRLTEQFRSRSVQKKYWALVPGAPRLESGTLTHWLRKMEPLQRMVVCSAQDPGAQRADLTYQTLRKTTRASLLEINLLTGRKHQIRAQLAEQNLPILGDKKYGSQVPFPKGIALHSRFLQFEHPVRHEPIQLVAPVPCYWPRWCVE